MESRQLAVSAQLEESLRQTTRELQAAHAELAQTRLIHSEFLWAMSHALRSPLTSILGFAQLMEVDVPTPTPSQKSSLTRIIQAGWGLLGMIDEILDASLIECGKLQLEMEPVSIEDVLRDCDMLVTPLAQQAEVQVNFAWPTKPLFVAADRTRLRQILMTLLGHALLHSGSAGVVHVSCKPCANGRLRVHFQDSSRGKSTEWLAHDNPASHIKLIVSKQIAGYMGGMIATELDATSTGCANAYWLELNAADRAP